MFVFGNVIKPQGLEPLQFPTKFRSPSLNLLPGDRRGGLSCAVGQEQRDDGDRVHDTRWTDSGAEPENRERALDDPGGPKLRADQLDSWLRDRAPSSGMGIDKGDLFGGSPLVCLVLPDSDRKPAPRALVSSPVCLVSCRVVTCSPHRETRGSRGLICNTTPSRVRPSPLPSEGGSLRFVRPTLRIALALSVVVVLSAASILGCGGGQSHSSDWWNSDWNRPPGQLYLHARPREEPDGPVVYRRPCVRGHRG